MTKQKERISLAEVHYSWVYKDRIAFRQDSFYIHLTDVCDGLAK